MQNLHVGTIGWSYSFWKGTFYNKKLPSSKLLAYYASQFNSVEVDSTFYRIPTMQTVTNWKRQTPEGFLFSLKFPNVITHVKMLKDSQQETNVFLERAKLLEEKLGPMLLQFPPSFTSKHLPNLADYLRELPKEHRFVVEVRNKSLLNEDLYAVLRANGIALAWVESALMPQVLELTSDFIYVRLEGDRKKIKGVLGKTEIERNGDIAVWAEKIKPYIEKGMMVFAYFGKYYSGYPPLDVKRLLDHFA